MASAARADLIPAWADSATASGVAGGSDTGAGGSGHGGQRRRRILPRRRRIQGPRNPPAGFPQPAPPPGFCGGGGYHDQQQPYAPTEPYYAQVYQAIPGEANLASYHAHMGGVCLGCCSPILKHQGFWDLL